LIGEAGGGVLETSDDGATWAPRTDDQPHMTIGAITFVMIAQPVYGNVLQDLPSVSIVTITVWPALTLAEQIAKVPAWIVQTPGAMPVNDMVMGHEHDIALEPPSV
jgi:hypothetical protein